MPLKMRLTSGGFYISKTSLKTVEHINKDLAKDYVLKARFFVVSPRSFN